MNETELKFEREDRSGVAVAGSYLIDATRRIGIEVEAECGRLGLCDSCAMTIKQGKDLLSAPTKAETEQLSDDRRKNGERLSCQAKIEKSGEVVIMTKEKKKEEKPSDEEKTEAFRKEFEELPLEKKIAALMKLEAIALSETFSFILNSPYKIADKVMDVMAEFGLKLDEEAKNAKTPEEHKTKEESAAEDKADSNGKRATRKSSAKKKSEA
jgi:ferredoxin